MEITENYGKIEDDEFYECITKHNEYIKINDEEYNNREPIQKFQSKNTNEKMGISSINFNLKDHNAYLIHKFTFQANIDSGNPYKPYDHVRYDNCTIFVDNYANTYNFYKPGEQHCGLVRINHNCPGVFYNLAKSYNETEKLPNKIVDIIKKIKILQEKCYDYLNMPYCGIFQPNEFDSIKLFKDNYEYLKKDVIIKDESNIEIKKDETEFVCEYKLLKDDITKVYLCGDFNNWQKEEMIYYDDTKSYKLIKKLMKGSYEYKFYINNEYVLEPSIETKINNNGYENNVVVIE